MKKLCIILIIVCLGFSGCFWSKKSRIHQVPQKTSFGEQEILVRRIMLEGFVLEDKKSLENITKPYQNKRLSQEKIKQIIDQIENLYLQAGYTNLVNIRYELIKHKLTIHITLKE